LGAVDEKCPIRSRLKLKLKLKFKFKFKLKFKFKFMGGERTDDYINCSSAIERRLRILTQQS